MKKKIVIIAVAVFFILVMFSPVSFAYPYPVAVGDMIKYVDGYGDYTGEMAVWKLGTDVALYDTFCVERSEYMYEDVYYEVSDISENAYYGGWEWNWSTPWYDPLSPETAYLYYNFVIGSLSGYDTSTEDAHRLSANALQIAIWYLEDEITVPVAGSGNWWTTGWGGYFKYLDANTADLANNFISLARNSGWTSIGNVRVVNIVESMGCKKINRQSSLIVVTPEPLTIFLISLAIPALGIMRKKYAK